jgi:hypothetical protein
MIVLLLLASSLLQSLQADPGASSSAAAADHLALLDSLTFLNAGTVESSDRFEIHSVSTIYNEDYSYMGQGTDSFHIGGHQSYLYRMNGTNSPSRCCWNRETLLCVNSSQCDLGGEGCVASGTKTKRYGVISCDPFPQPPPPPGYKKNAYPVDASVHQHADMGGFDIEPAIVKTLSTFEQCADYCGGIPGKKPVFSSTF